MRIPKFPRKKTLKKFLPTRLFARAVLILLVPIVILQVLVAYIFFERHWDSVVRNMSAAVAGDVLLLLSEYDRIEAAGGKAAALAETQRLGRKLGMIVDYNTDPSIVIEAGHGRDRFPELHDLLVRRTAHPFTLASLRNDNLIRVRLGVEGGVLDLLMSRKRLASSTTYIFIGWMVGSSALLMLIAILFLRNQIRPIVQLARAAEAFGLGQDVEGFMPKGASEIRRAANAFLLMADRIRRQVQSRTEMLAGISHDLRTPLTRMKLELEMGKVDSATKEALSTDIDEMGRMIDEYLDFARGDAGEPVALVDLSPMLRELAESYQRQGKPVTLEAPAEAVLPVRPQAVRRALSNIIENALRYGNQADILLEQTVAFMRIKVTDHGPGIPENEHETVFKPFTRLDPSRNVTTGGVGLGLSIARDVAQSHGGDITLENQKDAAGRITGLEVTLRLPREVHR